MSNLRQVLLSPLGRAVRLLLFCAVAIFVYRQSQKQSAAQLDQTLVVADAGKHVYHTSPGCDHSSGMQIQTVSGEKRVVYVAPISLTDAKKLGYTLCPDCAEVRSKFSQ
jgi:hypothetical protein